MEKIEKEFKEYKEFAFNNNMIKVAIGLILANAFQKSVSGISDYLIMPVINYFIGKTDGNWRNWIWQPLEGMNIEVGHLLGTLIDFVILSAVLYFIYSRILKRLWPNLEENKEEEQETVYVKRQKDGKWKVI